MEMLLNMVEVYKTNVRHKKGSQKAFGCFVGAIPHVQYQL